MTTRVIANSPSPATSSAPSSTTSRQHQISDTLHAVLGALSALACTEHPPRPADLRTSHSTTESEGATGEDAGAGHTGNDTIASRLPHRHPLHREHLAPHHRGLTASPAPSSALSSATSSQRSRPASHRARCSCGERARHHRAPTHHACVVVPHRVAMSSRVITRTASPSAASARSSAASCARRRSVPLHAVLGG